MLEEQNWQDMEEIPISTEPLDILIELAHINRLNLEPIYRQAQFAKAMLDKQGYDKETVDNLIEQTLLYLKIVLEFGDKLRPYLSEKKALNYSDGDKGID